MKILFLTNVPSPYRVDFFNELGKHCKLTVLFERDSSDERSNEWKNFVFENFKGVILKGVNSRVDAAFCFDVVKYLKKNTYDNIFVCNFSTPTGMLAIEYMRLKKIKYILESDGGFAKSGLGIKEKIKKHFIKGADGYFSTSQSNDNYYLTYGAKKENITRYPFTSLAEKEILQKPLGFLEKSNLRTELGIKEEKVIISIGQFINRKGFDILLNACKDISNEVGVYIIGGKATDEYLQIIREHNLSNIHFIEFQTKEMINRYLQASDIFVLPTREDIWGLVINEAMAQGLPVITTDKCVAGLELVENDINGYIVPVDDVSQLSQKMNKIRNDDDLMNSMAEKSLDKIRGYTIEKMSKRHIEVLWTVK